MRTRSKANKNFKRKVWSADEIGSGDDDAILVDEQPTTQQNSQQQAVNSNNENAAASSPQTRRRAKKTSSYSSQASQQAEVISLDDDDDDPSPQASQPATAPQVSEKLSKLATTAPVAQAQAASQNDIPSQPVSKSAPVQTSNTQVSSASQNSMSIDLDEEDDAPTASSAQDPQPRRTRFLEAPAIAPVSIKFLKQLFLNLFVQETRS